MANYISSLKCVVRDFAQLPLLKLSVGASIFELDKSVLIRACSATAVAGTSNCEVGLEVSETLTNEIIVGTSFFKRYYGYFDQDNREVGLARNKETYPDNGFSSTTGAVAGPTYTKLAA